MLILIYGLAPRPRTLRGYRLTFDDPLGHQALFGALVVLQSSPSAYAKEAENGP